MSELKNQNLLKQKEEYEKAAQETFNRILAAYRVVIDEISDESFEEVNKIISKEMKKSFERAGSAYKEHLFGMIKEKFTKIWSDREMNNSVALLEIAKKHYVTQEKYRPTNKTAEEQLRPHIGKMLLRQREILKQQIEEQKSKIANIIPVIEENRKNLQYRIHKREEMVSAMSSDMQVVEEMSSQVDKIMDQINNIANA